MVANDIFYTKVLSQMIFISFLSYITTTYIHSSCSKQNQKIVGIHVPAPALNSIVNNKLYKSKNV